MSDPVVSVQLSGYLQADAAADRRRELRRSLATAGLDVGLVELTVAMVDRFDVHLQQQREQTAALESIAASLETLANAPATGY
jgi:hypothetical protein